ncbi:MAG: hypothetical protein MUQ60_07350 [Porticoccaceae bacterium]|nr:hypothetical protein [Porticoccaceae bacterium]
MMNKEDRINRIFLPVAMVTIVVLGATILTYSYMKNNQAAKPQVDINLTQQQALVICIAQAREDYGEDLLQATFDPESSRSNVSEKTFSIFADLVIRGIEREPAYIRWEVSTENREIKDYRIKGMKRKSFF